MNEQKIKDAFLNSNQIKVRSIEDHKFCFLINLLDDNTIEVNYDELKVMNKEFNEYYDDLDDFISSTELDMFEIVDKDNEIKENDNKIKENNSRKNSKIKNNINIPQDIKLY